MPRLEQAITEFLTRAANRERGCRVIKRSGLYVIGGDSGPQKIGFSVRCRAISRQSTMEV